MQNLRYIMATLGKLLVVLILVVVLFVVGLMIGYGFFGEGSPKDILSPTIWQHIWQFIRG